MGQPLAPSNENESIHSTYWKNHCKKRGMLVNKVSYRHTRFEMQILDDFEKILEGLSTTISTDAIEMQA